MKKVILTIAIALITLTSFTSCSDNDYDEDLLNKTQLALQGMYDQYDALMIVKNDLQVSLEFALNEIAQLNVENASLKDVVLTLEGLNEALTTSLNDAFDLNKQLSSDLEATQSELDQSNALLEDSIALSESLQDDLEDAYITINQLNDTIGNQNITIDGQTLIINGQTLTINNLNLQIDSLSGVDAELEHRINKLLERIESKNQTIISLRNRVQKLHDIIKANRG